MPHRLDQWMALSSSFVGRRASLWVPTSALVYAASASRLLPGDSSGSSLRCIMPLLKKGAIVEGAHIATRPPRINRKYGVVWSRLQGLPSWLLGGHY